MSVLQSGVLATLLSVLFLSAQRGMEQGKEWLVITRTHEESVSLSLPDVPPVNFSELVWKRGVAVVARTKNNDTVPVHNNTSSLFPNGTLLLYKPGKTDEGLYLLEGFDKDGKLVISGSIRLDVQEPVSKPVLTIISCDNGMVNLKCAVQRGDNVSIQWDVKPGSGNTNQVYTDTGPVLSVTHSTSGEITCIALNNVSKEASDPLKPHCRANISFFVLLLLCASGSLILVILFLVFLCVKNKQTKKKNPDGIYIEMRMRPGPVDVGIAGNGPVSSETIIDVQEVDQGADSSSGNLEDRCPLVYAQINFL